MKKIKIKKGHDINIAGKARIDSISEKFPETVSISPVEFNYIKPKLLIEEGQSIRIGEPIFYDKNNPSVKWPSLASGVIERIEFGERRAILNIITRIDYESEKIQTSSTTNLSSREEVIKFLLDKNLFPFIQMRPFDMVANPAEKPKSIIVSFANTAPLGTDFNFSLSGEKKYITEGLKNLKHLTDGKIYVAVNSSQFDFVDDLEFVEKIFVEGPHPSGNIGVILNHVDPINNKDIIWTIKPQHLVILGKAFSYGIYDFKTTINLAGPGVKNPSYISSRLGANINNLCKDDLVDSSLRIISGDVLTGKHTSIENFIGFYHSSISVILESFNRPFIGWLHPGGKSKYSVFNAYFGTNTKPFEFTTLQNGSHRALVPIDSWEKVFPMNIYINALVRSIEAGDFEEMEKLGIYECSEEDVALCSFVCPSKTDVAGIIRKGLNMIYLDK